MTSVEEFLQSLEAETLWSIIETMGHTVNKKQNIISALKDVESGTEKGLTLEKALRRLSLDPEDPYVKTVLKKHRSGGGADLDQDDLAAIFEQHGLTRPNTDVSNAFIDKYLNAYDSVSLLSMLLRNSCRFEEDMKRFLGKKEEENITNFKKHGIEYGVLGLSLLSSLANAGEFRKHAYRLLEKHPLFPKTVADLDEKETKKLLLRLQAAVALKELETQHLKTYLPTLFLDISAKDAERWALELLMDKDYDGAVEKIVEAVRNKKVSVPLAEGDYKPVEPLFTAEKTLEEFKKTKKILEERTKKHLESAKKRIEML